MSGSIENKFDGIRIIEHKGNSDIKIRMSFNPLHFGAPLAIIDCGKCKETYKKKLFYLSGSDFSIDDDFNCPFCKNQDKVSYEKL